ncbi:phenylalanine--tRNA ligase subunit beta [Bacteroidota bacterium]
MLLSYNWLKTYLDIDQNPEEVAEILTNTGLEVEGVEQNNSLDLIPEGVLVGLVTEVMKHPEADKLTICKVDIGAETLQIICGAPNVAAGQKVPVATIGTRLNFRSGESLKIKRTKLRGVDSEGMICAEDELGLGDSHEGIMVLENTIPVGSKFRDTLKTDGDAIIEIAITPNRGDAISVLGVARDVAAVLNKKVNYPSVAGFKIESNKYQLKVEIDNPALCPRYSGVVVSGLEVKESPSWLKDRLKSIGLKPINNIVDACNFLMYENGQPLHAFDLDKIQDHTIIVKTLPAATAFKTLDESEVKLSGDEIMICDASSAVAIGGVMGGFNSMVTSSTTAILIESAHFNPTSIRKTSRAHGFFTDASYRFERGTDPNFTIDALKRAALLIQEIAGGNISSEITDVYPLPVKPQHIILNYEFVNRVLGNELSRNEIRDILQKLEYHVSELNADELDVIVPTYRPDVLRPIDLAEEVLRIYSYNKITFSQQLVTPLPEGNVEQNSKFADSLAKFIVSQGFYELLTPSFLPSSVFKDREPNSDLKPVKSMNSVNTNLDTLRDNFVYSGLEALSYNFKRNQYNLKLFEFGRIYYQNADQSYSEEDKMALWVCGNISGDSWYSKNQKADYYYLKAIVENLLQLSRIPAGLSEERQNAADFEYMTEYKFGNKVIACMGLVGKNLSLKYDLKDEVFYAELNMNELFNQYSSKTATYKAVTRYPFVLRDLSVIIPSEVRFSEIKRSIRSLTIPLLKEIHLIDVYVGKNLKEGTKSYAFRMKFQDEENTLKDNQVDLYISTIISILEKAHKAIIRK